MADNRQQLTVIGPDTFIKGEMIVESAACILGKFEGRIAGTGEITIGQSAICKASVDSARVIVEGAIEGDVIARERLELHPGAIVHGDITAAKLIVAEGATFIGHCRVGETAVKQQGAAGTHKPEQTSGPIPFETSRARIPGKPSPMIPAASDIENTLAGFETKLAEFARVKSAAGGE